MHLTDAPCCCDKCRAFLLDQLSRAFGPTVEEITKASNTLAKELEKACKTLAKELEDEKRKEGQLRRALHRKNESWRKGPCTKCVQLPQRTAHRQYRRKKARF